MSYPNIIHVHPGSYVRVRDQSWCCAIEVAIGFGNLISFIVDNQHDGNILREIIQQVSRNYPGKPYPSVLTSSFDGRVYDVSQNVRNFINSFKHLFLIILFSDSSLQLPYNLVNDRGERS